MASYSAAFLTDLARPSGVTPIPHVFAMGDNQSHTFTALVYNSEDPDCGLMAGSVSGAVVTPTGGTVVLTGEKGEAPVPVTLPDGSTAQATACSVTLLQACFACAGQITVVIRLVAGDAQTTVFIGRGTVTTTRTDTLIDPGEVIEDLATLIETARQAASDASSAVSQASAIVSYAEQTPTDAQRAQARANIGAQGILVEAIETDTSGCYLRVESGQTSVTMQDGAPALTSATNTYKCCVVPCAEGEFFTFTGARNGQSSPGYIFLDDSGNILGQYNNAAAIPETLLTAPAGSAMLYFLRTSSGNAANNAMWRGVTPAAMKNYIDAQIADLAARIGE